MNMKLFKKSSFLLLFLVTTSLFQNCSKDRDDEIEKDPEIVIDEVKDFIWKAMNFVYLYKDNVADLADDRFSSLADYDSYLDDYDTPEDLFYDLVYQPQTVDRFSWIVDDYVELDQELNGVYKTNGVEYLFYYQPNSNSKVMAVVRMVLKGSTGEAAGVTRGQIVHAVNGVEMTVDNYYDLIYDNGDSYTLNFADYIDNGTSTTTDDYISDNGTSVSTTNVVFTEDPVHYSDIIEVGGVKIGYLVYNGFTDGYSSELNSIFGDFKAANIDELVLDLRYNPGGRGSEASNLSSMITGQFTNQVFSRLIFNDNLSSENFDYKFTSTLPGGAAINSLNLDKVYIIATGRSASASEMVINGLNPYIDVVHVGSNTVGKTQASLTVYDSPGLFDKDGINPNHTYALQPLIANFVNSTNTSVPGNGFTPDIEIEERPNTLGVLGDVDEPLLAAAIADITGTGRHALDTSEFRSLVNPIDIKQTKPGLIIGPNEVPSDLKMNLNN